MSYKERFKSAISFKPASVTILVLLAYVAIYISVAVTDDLPSIPAEHARHGLDLDQAYADLHQIAGLPHPYNSHQNDIVRDYVLQRVQDIAGSSPFVDIDNDLTSNVTYGTRSSQISSPGTAIYFEGSNILVRVNGTQPDVAARGAVLFSAHFDSVSTAPGATDDGMGVVTLLAMLEHFVNNRPKRTVIFNINNGEEDGLNGAHAFLEHAWSKEPKDFINLEGAGAGGRPLLFRSTSKRLSKIWAKSAHVHAQSFTADAFARGVVRSDTDYTVYTSAGMGGLDFAFYRQRAKYHTRDDSIPSLGGKGALWAMMESTFLAGRALTEDENGDPGELPSYFDLFGETLVVTATKVFYGVNIALLVVGPIIIGALVFALYRTKKLYWPLKGWGRTWASLIIGSALTIGLGKIYVRVNPFIAYSSGTLVFASLLSIAMLSFRLVQQFFAHFVPVTQQRTMAFVEYYVFCWILLVADTAVIGGQHITGLTFITFMHAGAFAALLVGLIEQFTLPPIVDDVVIQEHIVEDGEEDYDSTERTPLLAQNGHVIKKSEINEENDYGLWIVQFLLTVPFPLILVTQISVVAINALGQTLSDGNAPGMLYLLLSLCAILSMAPLLPFAHKLYRGLSFALVVFLAASIIYCTLAFPFSSESPLKVFFQQGITLDTKDANNSVRLTGVRPWLEERIVPEIPSSWNGSVRGDWDQLRDLSSRIWPSLPPNVDSTSPETWVSVKTSKTSPGIGEITIRGVNTRNCRIYFDSTPVSSVSVHGASENGQAGWPVSKSVKELQLWSREWEKTFEVGVAWNTSASEILEGRVACGWAERALVPALEEVEAFLPRWARVTKRTYGLLEGEKHFKIE